MKSKKSFFNKTMFLKDIIRLWPLWVIGVIITLFAFAVPFFTNSVELLSYGASDYDMGHMEVLNEIREYIAGDIIGDGNYLICMAFMAIICAVLVFQYLNRQCSSYMLHSFPISRSAMYVTHYLSGFTMFLFPFFLLWCVLGVLNVLFGIHMGAAMFGYALETVMIALFFYSLACFVVMLSSSSIMSLFLYGVINFMVYVFYNMAETVVALFTYGTGSYYAGGFDWKGLVSIFTPCAYFIDTLGEQAPVLSDYDEIELETILYSVDGLPIGDFHYGSVILCLLYLIPAIVFFVAALLLYKKRKLERVDENLVFSWSKVIYRVVFCCCGSYIFTWLMYYLTYAIFSHLITYQYAYLIGIVYLLIGAVVCYLICDMILAKSFFIWKRLSYVQMGLITAGIVVVFIVGHHVYIKHSVCNASQVKAVEVAFHDETFHITGKERVDSLLSYQKEVMKQGNRKLMYDADNPGTDSRLAEDESSSNNMSFRYLMKNKAEINRSYRITTKEDALLTDMILFFNDTGYLVQTVLPDTFDKEHIMMADFGYYMENGDAFVNPQDSMLIVHRDEMYDAMMKDLQEGHIVFGNIYKKNQRGYVDCGKRIGTLSFVYETKQQKKSVGYKTYTTRSDIDYDDERDYRDFVITDECSHVLKVLEREEAAGDTEEKN